jgi:hypothetical protein
VGNVDVEVFEDNVSLGDEDIEGNRDVGRRRRAGGYLLHVHQFAQLLEARGHLSILDFALGLEEVEEGAALGGQQRAGAIFEVEGEAGAGRAVQTAAIEEWRVGDDAAEDDGGEV